MTNYVYASQGKYYSALFLFFSWQFDVDTENWFKK